MKARLPDLPLVALALAAALAAGCQEAAAGDDHAGHDGAPAGAPGAAAGDEVAHYTCSMHLSVRNGGPGTCPMCSMALAPVFRRELDSGEIVLDAGRRRQIGVATARAEMRPLAGPVRAVGTVTYDQSRLTDVTLRVGGWIDQLYADRIGQRVKEGEPLFTLYSPDLFEAQQEYADGLEKLREARMLGSPLIADLLLATRRQRLRLADLGPDELAGLEKRLLPVELVPILAPATGHVIEKNVVAGAAVAPGMTLLRIAGLDRVWVEAEVYESELPLLAVGDPATVTLRYLPGREFHGRIAFVYPWLDSATRTGRVRVELPNPGLALKPQMYAEVTFERDLGERLAVPQSAVLYAGDRDFVFLDLGDGRLRPQAVTVGGHAGEWVEILDGVAEGDLVVTSGNFLVAAEARLGLALEHWGPREGGPGLAASANGDGGGHGGHAHGGGHAGNEHGVAHAVDGNGGGHAGHGNGAKPPAPAYRQGSGRAGHANGGGHAEHGNGGGHAGHAEEVAGGGHAAHGGDATGGGNTAQDDGGGEAANGSGGAHSGHGGGRARQDEAGAGDGHAGHGDGDGHAGDATGEDDGHAGHGDGGGHAGDATGDGDVQAGQPKDGDGAHAGHGSEGVHAGHGGGGDRTGDATGGGDAGDGDEDGHAAHGHGGGHAGHEPGAAPSRR